MLLVFFALVPEKAMYSDLFLPLDDYISDAQYMDPR